MWVLQCRSTHHDALSWNGISSLGGSMTVNWRPICFFDARILVQWLCLFNNDKRHDGKVRCTKAWGTTHTSYLWLMASATSQGCNALAALAAIYCIVYITRVYIQHIWLSLLLLHLRRNRMRNEECANTNSNSTECLKRTVHTTLPCTYIYSYMIKYWTYLCQCLCKEFWYEGTNKTGFRQLASATESNLPGNGR